jgi:hypothetical protein
MLQVTAVATLDPYVFGHVNDHDVLDVQACGRPTSLFAAQTSQPCSSLQLCYSR